jgi:hypothetical protein
MLVRVAPATLAPPLVSTRRSTGRGRQGAVGESNGWWRRTGPSTWRSPSHLMARRGPVSTPPASSTRRRNARRRIAEGDFGPSEWRRRSEVPEGRRSRTVLRGASSLEALGLVEALRRSHGLSRRRPPGVSRWWLRLYQRRELLRSTRSGQCSGARDPVAVRLGRADAARRAAGPARQGGVEPRGLPRVDAMLISTGALLVLAEAALRRSEGLVDARGAVRSRSTASRGARRSCGAWRRRALTTQAHHAPPSSPGARSTPQTVRRR